MKRKRKRKVKRRVRKYKIANFSFTLIELLVVITILGILATLVAGGLRIAQTRGRDAKRKSDLKEVSNSLEIFLSDHGRYPNSSECQIQACPYDSAGPVGSADCTWGSSEFEDNNTTYFKTLPADPLSSQSYCYQIISGSNNQKYQLLAELENPEDPDCLWEDCSFAVTSPNITPIPTPTSTPTPAPTPGPTIGPAPTPTPSPTPTPAPTPSLCTKRFRLCEPWYVGPYECCPPYNCIKHSGQSSHLCQ